MQLRIGISFDDFELDRPHASPHDESIPRVDGPVGLEEVGLEVDLEPVACEALHGVVNGQDVDPLAVLDVGAGLDGNHVAKADTQVVAHNSVHANLNKLEIKIHNQDIEISLFTFSSKTVSSERTMQTLSFLFLPLRRTVSPLKSWSSSILARERATTELLLLKSKFLQQLPNM